MKQWRSDRDLSLKLRDGKTFFTIYDGFLFALILIVLKSQTDIDR